MLKRINEDTWSNPIGYCNRNDITNLNERYLTAGTQNVLIENIDDNSTRVMTRWGFSVCNQIVVDQANGNYKYLNSYRWDTNNTKTRFFVSYLYETTPGVAGAVTYVFKDGLCGTTIANNLSACNTAPLSQWTEQGMSVRYASWYDYNLLKEVMIIASGEKCIQTYDSNDVAINYPISQMVTNNNYTSPGTLPPFPPEYTIDYVAVYNNQLYIGSRNSRVVYVSRCTTDSTFYAGNFPGFTDFRFTQYTPEQTTYSVNTDSNGNAYVVPTTIPASGRQPCEGAEILLDSNCRGFGQQNGILNIFTDKHHIYEVEIAQGQFNNSEEIRVKRLKTSSGQGAISQELVSEIKNGLVYVTKEKTVDILSEIENFSSIQAKPINDIVQADFDNFDYTDAKIYYHKRNIFFTFPRNETVMVYNLERGYWQPPQKMVIGGFLSSEDKLYGFEYVSDGTLEIYALDCFNYLNKVENDLSLTDDGAPINAKIVIPYTHLGIRNHQKYHTEIFIEGYINEVSEITVTCLYEYGGSKGIQSKVITGYQENGKRDFIRHPVDTVSIGKSQLGENNLGNNKRYILPKFHVSKTFNPKPNYYERQIIFSGDKLEQRWGIISFSTNANIAADTNQAQRD